MAVRTAVTPARRGRAPLAAAVLALGAAALPLVAAGPAVATAGAPAPVIEPAPSAVFDGDAPDPAVLRDGDRYYAYTTGTTWGNHIGVLVSDDPATGWRTATGRRYGSTALGPLPAWQVKDTQNAPAVERIGGRYVMYYAAVDRDTGRYCITTAVSDGPGGPFHDTSAGGLVCQAEGSTDPAVFVDSSGRPWLHWKSNDGASTAPAVLWAAPLAADGLTLAGDATGLVAQDMDAHPWQATIENPHMVRAAGTHYLLFSGGLWDSPGYAQGYAVCAGPAGPCSQPRAGPVLASYGDVEGPGGGALFTDPSGRWWLAYHGWRRGCTAYACGGARRLFVAPVRFGETRPTTRLEGTDRHATAAAVSRATFPGGAPVAYVTGGAVHADALAAGPAATARGGPVLLTGRDALPRATADELTRLAPGRIVIAGGTGAVGAGVEAALRRHAPAVVRLAGPNRWATAAAVSRDAFPPGVGVAYVTGEGFADALAAGPAAAREGGPLLLVAGDGVPSATADELARLEPREIAVVGGTGAVSDAVVERLRAFAPSVVRLAGPDRFATAAAVAGRTDPSGAGAVYLATGLGFADAVSGAPAAATTRAPLLLVSSGCVPPAVQEAIRRLDPSRLVVLGGPSAVGPGVEAATICR